MVACPRCSYENKDSAINCVNCRVNLHWALENPHEAVRYDVERVEGPPPPAQGRDRVPKVRTSSARGCFLVIVLLLAMLASGFLAFWNLLSYGFTPDTKEQLRSGYMTGAWLWLVVAAVCFLAAIVVLLRSQPKARLLSGLRILVLIALTGGLLFGLMRFALVILPEHTGRGLTLQYKLGERDFRGATLGAADLSESKLRGANLSKAHLSGAKLSGADLRGADLSGADLGGADLRGATLYQANLRQTDLREANLSGAWLSQANLSEANLYRADLSEANLTEATVTDEQLAAAGSLEGATMPDGSKHE